MQRKTVRPLNTVSVKRKTVTPLNSVSVPNAIAVLIEESDFDKRDGISYYKSGNTIKGRPVRRMQAKEVRTPAMLMKAASVPVDWVDFLFGVKKLQQMEGESRDPVVLEDAYQFMAPTLGFDPKKPMPKKFGGMLTLSLVLALDGLRTVFWRTRPNKSGDTRLLPGLFAPDMKTAAAACWLLSPELRVCTHCHRIFFAKRPLQTACKAACRETHRIARFWAKRRGKVAA
jgi:hypothetical protein